MRFQNTYSLLFIAVFFLSVQVQSEEPVDPVICLKTATTKKYFDERCRNEGLDEKNKKIYEEYAKQFKPGMKYDQPSTYNQVSSMIVKQKMADLQTKSDAGSLQASAAQGQANLVQGQQAQAAAAGQKGVGGSSGTQVGPDGKIMNVVGAIGLGLAGAAVIDQLLKDPKVGVHGGKNPGTNTGPGTVTGPGTLTGPGTITGPEVVNKPPEVVSKPPDVNVSNLATKADVAKLAEAKNGAGQYLGPEKIQTSDGFINEKPDAPQTEMSAEANGKSSELRQKVSGHYNTLSKLYSGGPAVPQYTKSTASLKQFNTSFTTFDSSTKPTCTKAAEMSGFLCIEGTSPGAKAAKGIVDMGSMALPLLNSAYKSCDGTAKVMNYAGMLITAAKGACVTAKMACDGVCAGALGSAEALSAKDVAALETALGPDQIEGMKFCYERNAGDTIAINLCVKNEESRKASITKEIQAIRASLKPESDPVSKGSTAGLVKKCEQNMKDIALLALNAASMFAASKNGEECAKKLAAQGAKTGDAGLSAADWCKKPENSKEEYCKCLNNSMAEGCPGYAANNGNSQMGASLNLKSGKGGASGFAGGIGGTPTGSSDLGSLSSEPGEEKPGVTASNSSGVMGSGPLSGGSAGGGGAAVASDDEKAGNTAGKKKFDYSSAGSMSAGGSSGSYGRSGKFGANGALSSSQKEILDRKIASDRLAMEVSGATGKSNWEKVHNTYKINETSLNYSGQ